MIQVEFVPSGSDMNQAMVSTCELTSKIFLEKNTELNFKYIDIRCLSAEDAESLDELMWSIPQNALIPHKLVHNQNNNSQIDIGYPGIIFPVKEKKILINITTSPGMKLVERCNTATLQQSAPILIGCSVQNSFLALQCRLPAS